MPIYEYRCLKCGEQLELLVRGSKEPLQCGEECPHEAMGEGRLERMISLPAPHSSPASNSQIANSGLTKLKKTSDGKYERVAGPKLKVDNIGGLPTV